MTNHSLLQSLKYEKKVLYMLLLSLFGSISQSNENQNPIHPFSSLDHKCRSHSGQNNLPTPKPQLCVKRLC